MQGVSVISAPGSKRPGSWKNRRKLDEPLVAGGESKTERLGNWGNRSIVIAIYD